MKKLVTALLMIFLLNCDAIAALQLEDITTAKDAFYRLGTTDTPEIKVPEGYLSFVGLKKISSIIISKLSLHIL